MDHVRDACNNLRDRRTVRGEDIGRSDVLRTPVEVFRAAVHGHGIRIREDAVDGANLRSRICAIDGTSGSGRVVRERAVQEIDPAAAILQQGAAQTVCRVAAESRVDKQCVRAMHIHRAGMMAGSVVGERR